MDEEPMFSCFPSKELTYQGDFKGRTANQLVINNLTDKCLLFKLKTTSPDKFAVKPPDGFIQPKQSKTISVNCLPFVYRPQQKYRDKFLIRVGKTESIRAESQFKSLWTLLPENEIEERKLGTKYIYNARLPEIDEENESEKELIENVFPSTFDNDGKEYVAKEPDENNVEKVLFTEETNNKIINEQEVSNPEEKINTHSEKENKISKTSSEEQEHPENHETTSWGGFEAIQSMIGTFLVSPLGTSNQNKLESENKKHLNEDREGNNNEGTLLNNAIEKGDILDIEKEIETLDTLLEEQSCSEEQQKIESASWGGFEALQSMIGTFLVSNATKNEDPEVSSNIINNNDEKVMEDVEVKPHSDLNEKELTADYMEDKTTTRLDNNSMTNEEKIKSKINEETSILSKLDINGKEDNNIGMEKENENYMVEHKRNKEKNKDSKELKTKSKKEHKHSDKKSHHIHKETRTHVKLVKANIKEAKANIEDIKAILQERHKFVAEDKMILKEKNKDGNAHIFSIQANLKQNKISTLKTEEQPQQTNDVANLKKNIQDQKETKKINENLNKIMPEQDEIEKTNENLKKTLQEQEEKEKEIMNKSSEKNMQEQEEKEIINENLMKNVQEQEESDNININIRNAKINNTTTDVQNREESIVKKEEGISVKEYNTILEDKVYVETDQVGVKEIDENPTEINKKPKEGYTNIDIKEINKEDIDITLMKAKEGMENDKIKSTKTNIKKEYITNDTWNESEILVMKIENKTATVDKSNIHEYVNQNKVNIIEGDTHSKEITKNIDKKEKEENIKEMFTKASKIINKNKLKLEKKSARVMHTDTNDKNKQVKEIITKVTDENIKKNQNTITSNIDTVQIDKTTSFSNEDISSSIRSKKKFSSNMEKKEKTDLLKNLKTMAKEITAKHKNQTSKFRTNEEKEEITKLRTAIGLARYENIKLKEEKFHLDRKIVANRQAKKIATLHEVKVTRHQENEDEERLIVILLLAVIGILLGKFIF